jgi:cellulose synthase (UDP-forming)
MRLPWAVVLLGLLAARYLHWRVTATLNLDTPLAASLSVLLLASELWLLAHGFLQLLFSLAPERPGQAVPASSQHAAAPPPSVDVLVPSYGEPLDVVERCLRGCRALRYPNVQVWLLDDAARPELAVLAARLGCRYSSREQRQHAKAGNLNHVLPRLEGELIAVFDADVVPVQAFLEQTVTPFADPRVGLVQTSQTYMNADPVIRNLGLERWLMPDEESFYRWIEPVRQRLGAVVCAGTSFVVRRQALLAVGGFETGTPSEDLATGIRLTAAGWRLVFLDEKLSAGLAPLTLAALARQRCRWASGTLQTLRTGANPLLIPGLNPLQRLAFLEGILHWLNVLPQLVLVLMPLSLGVLGVAPLRVSGAGLLTMALPLVLAQLLLARWFSAHSRTALMPELYRWVVLGPLAWTVLTTLLGRVQPFQVTPKELPSGRATTPEKRLLLPLLGLLSLQGVALVNLVPLLNGTARIHLAPVSASTLTVSVGWALLNGLLLVASLRCCRDRPRPSAVPWLAWGESVTLDERPAELCAISEEGLELRLVDGHAADHGLAKGRTLRLGLANHDHWPVLVEALSGPQLGCSWGPLSESQRARLQQLLYQRSGQWPTRRAPAEPLALAATALRLVRPMPAEDWFQRSLLPVLPPTMGQASPRPRHRHQTGGSPREMVMFLRIRHNEDSSLVEVLDLQQLFDPFATSVLGRLHAGEELQDPAALSKGDLSFPSGEPLPRCWLDPHYQS